MLTPLDLFNDCIRRVRELHAVHGSLEQIVTVAVDLSDILRAELVLLVSALDFFIHEITREGMLQTHANSRPMTEAFKKFPLPIETALRLDHASLEAEVRSRHGYLSFQQPDKIADAVRLFSSVELWKEVSGELKTDAKSLKTSISLIVERRNKIAHEADVDPSYPNQRWPIDRGHVEYALELIELVAGAIYKVTR